VLSVLVFMNRLAVEAAVHAAHRFYRATLCQRDIMLSSRHPMSVRLSVTSRNSTKTVKLRIMQTTLYDSPGTSVF